MTVEASKQCRAPRRLGRFREAGQTTAEFALLIPLFLFLLLAAITFAVIGEAVLAVNQLAYTGARYAAVNPQLSAGELQSFLSSGTLGSPTITGGGGANLSIQVQPAGGFGQPVSVTVTFDLSSNPLVSNMNAVFSALGFGQSFPTSLTATETVMSE